MAQHDYVISNGTGAAVRSDLNNALLAIVSQNSGATEPTTTYAYQWWADTTTGLLKIRNSANNAWVTLRELDGTLTVEDGTVSAPGLAFRDDLNTGIWRPGTDQFAISTNGIERVEWGTSEVVFNDGGTNYDFRIEGDNNANLLFVDASADAVGIGTSSPLQLLHLNSAAATNTTLAYSENGTLKWYNRYNASDGSFQIVDVVNTATRLHVSNTGNVGIGTTSPTRLFHTLDSANTIVGRIESGQSSSWLQFAASGNGTASRIGSPDGSGIANIAFMTNDLERARIDSSGRLLVGASTALSTTFSGSALLQVVKDANNAAQVFAFSGAGQDYPASLELCRGRGTKASPSAVSSGDWLGSINFYGHDGTQFIPGAYIIAQADATTGTNDLPTRLVFSTTADGASSPTERMRITNAGALSYSPCSGADLVGAEAAGFVGDNIYAPFYKIKTALTSTKWAAQFHNGNGQVGSISMNGSATAFNTSSDYRLKENVTKVTDSITRLQQLKPSRFNFIADPSRTVDGFIAHEVQAVVPEAITGEKDAVDDEGNPIYQGIDQSKLVPLLTAALQEAVAKIESLEARLTAAGI